MLDTKVGVSNMEVDPAEVAKIGFDAMQGGEADVVDGVMNKLLVLGDQNHAVTNSGRGASQNGQI